MDMFSLDLDQMLSLGDHAQHLHVVLAAVPPPGKSPESYVLLQILPGVLSAIAALVAAGISFLTMRAVRATADDNRKSTERIAKKNRVSSDRIARQNLDASKVLAERMAGINADFNRELEELKADFGKELKQEEFRLSHMKALVQKRIDVYDEAIDFFSRVMGIHAKENGELVSIPHNLQIFTQYLAKASGILGRGGWMTKEAGLLVAHWAFAANDYHAVLKSGHLTSAGLSKHPKYKKLSEKTNALRRILLEDYPKLYDLEQWVKDFQVALTITPTVSEE